MIKQESGPTRAVRREAEEAAAQFPALLVEAERVAQAVASGLHGRRRAGPGENFWQHRSYAFGDPVSAIDWRQSARTADRLYVRQNEWETAAAVWIWRDPSASLDYRFNGSVPTKKRRADVLAVALAILLADAGERIGLLGLERAWYGRVAPMRILEALMADGVNSASAPRADITSGARIALVSDFFIDLGRLRNTVSAYADAGAKGLLLQIVDPAEEDFPFSGRIDFEDVESRDRLTLGEAGSLADSYRAKFRAHREAAADIARGLGWTFIAHRTDRPPQAALLAVFRALSDLKALK
jgi:uncharacterized protein (DUF58 family)